MTRDYPGPLVPAGHVEPVPRRVRAFLGKRSVLDTTSALYVWETQKYPQFHIPVADVEPGVLVDEGRQVDRALGLARSHGLRAGDVERPRAGWTFDDGELAGTVRLRWDALDAWYEEDEQVFVHPRNPYARVDALRSSRHVRVELDGVALADSSATVMVFETGLPTRYYFDRSAVAIEQLEPSDTETACPYKGVTSGYWSARVGDELHRDVAWAYDFPTAPLLPIAGLVAFFNELVDVVVDGTRLERPQTPFSRGA